jgi:FkbM family methyltransferase
VKKTIQDGLLSLYRHARRRGVFATPLGRWLFLRAYWTYKRLWEPDITFLRRFVPRDAWIVDVGANVGFFSRQFCGWVSGNGRVLAFEPERENFQALEAIARASRCRHALVPRQSLVADSDTTLHLELNPDNPADHHIGSEGIPTRAVKLDTEIKNLGWPRVGLIKVDVQGVESLVIEGAKETLERSRPAILMEIDDAALGRFGSSAERLEAQLAACGYAMYEADGTRLGTSISTSRAQALRGKLGYADFVFLPRER